MAVKHTCISFFFVYTFISDYLFIGSLRLIDFFLSGAASLGKLIATCGDALKIDTRTISTPAAQINPLYYTPYS